MPSPLTREFWFADIDARPLALFRIGLGLVLLRDWIEWLPDLVALFSSDGIFPHGGPMAEFRWSVFALVDGAGGAYALWAVGLVALIGLTLGLFTRVSTIVAWVMLVSLHNRNTLLLSSGDRVAELLLLTSLFTQLSSCWSVDARLSPRPPLASATGLRFMQIAIACLYFFTGILKARGFWSTGQGIWMSLQFPGFLRPPGELLSHFPQVCRVMNDVVLVLEIVFPFLAFSPVARRRTVPLAILCGLGVQLGILATMRVGTFTALMIWVNVLFIEPEWLDWLAKRVPRVPALHVNVPAFTTVRPRQWAVGGVLAVMYALIVWPCLIGNRVPMPKPLQAIYRGASLEQFYLLFVVREDVIRWDAIGTTASGQEVEVLPTTAPGLRPRVGWAYNPWYKLTLFKDQLDHPALERWLCREYEQKTGTPLQTLALVEHRHPSTLIGDPVAPDVDIPIWSGPCSDSSSSP